MSGLAQFLLIVVISTLTFLITVVAIQVFKLIQEARFAVRKLSQLLDNTQTISAVNQFFSEVRGLVDTTENKIVSEIPDRVMSAKKTTAPSRRFFHRAGQMLRASRPS